MPTLQTPQEFVSTVRERRLVDAARLKEFVASVSGIAAFTARRLADRAVAVRLLTRFQADEVLAGRADRLVLADYRLLSRLGEGGSGEVYLAEHVPTGDRRAVKVLDDECLVDPVAGKRLSREASAVSSLCHPNVVRVFEFDPGDGARSPFLAMEYVDGVSLQAAVALGGTFTAEATAECGRQAGLALQHAWDVGLVHRDVKPANLLLTRDGQLKVSDFGQVRVPVSAGLTLPNGKLLLGTAAYVAPEQVSNGAEVDCRADVYALGGTLYFLLAGHPPFPHADEFDRLKGNRHKVNQHDSLVPIHQLRPDVPEGLSAVISQMLAERPDRRPLTPAVAARLLARWADPNFATPLFVRLDRVTDDTPSEGTLFTPAPALTEESASAGGSTDDVPVLQRVVSCQPGDTARMAQPALACSKVSLVWAAIWLLIGALLGVLTFGVVLLAVAFWLR